MSEKPTVTIRTAMDTDDVLTILEKIEDDLIEIDTDLDFDNCDKQSLATKIRNLLDFVQSFSYDIENGWCAILINGVPLGGGKAVNQQIKNHYPKGLRIQH